MLKQAVILVGGRGERLGELTQSTPKPMMAIGNTTFLEILVDEVARHGFLEIFLLCGYRAESILSVFDGKTCRNAKVSCFVEEIPKGTAGALTVVADLLDDEFLLLNGDSLFDINQLDLLTVATEENWEGKVALRSLPDTGRFGTVILEDERIVSFAEKTGAGPGLINAGIYLLKKTVLTKIQQVPCSLERDILPQLARDGLLYGRAYQGYFIDIGVPEDLLRAQMEIPNRNRPTAFLDRDGVLNHDYGYVYRIDDFHWTVGAISGIKHLNDKGWLVIVVTNQAGVARGYYEESAVISLHNWIQSELNTFGAHVDAFYYCPHHVEGSVEKYKIECDCRKPNPEMLFTAMRDFKIDINKSILIGDKQSDLDAGQAIGIKKDSLLLVKSNSSWIQFVLDKAGLTVA